MNDTDRHTATSQLQPTTHYRVALAGSYRSVILLSFAVLGGFREVVRASFKPDRSDGFVRV